MLEAICTRCSGVFVPHSTEPEDLVHLVRKDGTDCGGLGIIQGQWTIDGETRLVDYRDLQKLEEHARAMPFCEDPDCEFHHPEVRES